jgi:Aminoglycoside-2''-adenylyltransferase
MADADLGKWQPLTPTAVAALFADCPSPWWIAGGHAIDALVGRNDRRPHEDIDVGILARDQGSARATLSGWDLHCVDPPGQLRPWPAAEILEEPVHDIWARERPGGSWQFQLVLNTSEGGDWVYRRDDRVRFPLSELVWLSEGVPYLAPEVQLLFKSKGVRPKDEQDFRDSLLLLGGRQRRWLRDALRVTDHAHPWLGLL